ncbi:hypothetical protein [Sporomusa sp. KB1]|jgi:hypothetical protein|uniref:hypothetical protein n=1 Tax=Sporomusa sp. KB1 TaxID=943346 RepID=UPI0011A5CDB9|nr:hypothetical protein [Sporomusa sp. KB1]TWH48528.1 hypothetical protein Salpa_4692 [Sporomusa sp. KB1]
MDKINATESDLIRALFLCHKERGDLFFAHVKTGASWVRKGCLHILDGLGVKVSWSNPVFHGYEIKISRGDFKRDNKYKEYLPYCTAFSFVCPDKMIAKDEISDTIGLIYYRENGSLRTVRKAAETKPDTDLFNSMLRYLVYYRTGSDRQQIAAAISRVERERLLRTKAEDDAEYLRKTLYKLQDDYYELKHGKEA